MDSIQNSTAASAYQGVLPSQRQDAPAPQPQAASQPTQPAEPAQRVEETPRTESGSTDNSTGSQVDTYA